MFVIRLMIVKDINFVSFCNKAITNNLLNILEACLSPSISLPLSTLKVEY